LIFVASIPSAICSHRGNLSICIQQGREAVWAIVRPLHQCSCFLPLCPCPTFLLHILVRRKIAFMNPKPLPCSFQLLSLFFFSDPLRRHTHTNTLQIRITLCQTCWVAVYLVLDPVQFPLFVSHRCLRKILRPDISQAFSVVTSEIDESGRGLFATFFFLHFRP
jgi:hypothetical protein